MSVNTNPTNSIAEDSQNLKECKIGFPSKQEVEDSADKFLEEYSNDFKKMSE